MIKAIEVKREIVMIRKSLRHDKGTHDMPINWKEHIISTPDVLRGKKDTRIP